MEFSPKISSYSMHYTELLLHFNIFFAFFPNKQKSLLFLWKITLTGLSMRLTLMVRVWVLSADHKSSNRQTHQPLNDTLYARAHLLAGYESFWSAQILSDSFDFWTSNTKAFGGKWCSVLAMCFPMSRKYKAAPLSYARPSLLALCCVKFIGTGPGFRHNLAVRIFG